MDTSTLLANLLIDGLVTGSLYALVAIGFSLMWWLSDIVHLAHGGVMLVAGYVVFAVVAALGWPLALGLLLSLLVVMALSLIIDEVIYRPLQERKTSEMGLITASLGILIALEFGLIITFGPEGVSADAGGLRAPLASPMLMAFDGYSVLVLGTALVAFAALGLFMGYTRIGRELRAVAENRHLARVLGIDGRKAQRITCMLAAALVVPVSAFYLFNVGVTPHEILYIILIAAAVAIIGGRGSIAGALLAGLVVGVTESVMVWFFDSGWRLVVTFGLLYALLLIRPQGLFGKVSTGKP
ncbi:MAG: branched-chain amino acid ABC transporter permease [Aquisalimonadaceae bacterium]